MTAVRTGPALVLLAVLICCACSEPEPEPSPPDGSPEAATLTLFRFASTMTDESKLPPDLIRDDLAEEYRADLLDLLEELVGTTPPRILSVERFPDTDRAAVDLEFDLPGEGYSTWSVQLEGGDDEGWRLVWVQGPGNSWPPRKRGRGEGLSSSDEGGRR